MSSKLCIPNARPVNVETIIKHLLMTKRKWIKETFSE